MNKTILIGLVIIFLVFTVSAATYEQNKALDLKVPCLNNNTFCSGSATCNITILYPNSSNLIIGESMENYGTYFNYTLTPNQTLITGEYTTTVVCNDGDFNGFDNFNYNINPIGKVPSSSTQGFAIAIVIAMAVGAVISYLIGNSFKKEDQRWFHLLFRAAFYMFSIGFVMQGIGTLDKLSTQITELTEIGGVIHGGVVLSTRILLFLFIVVFLFFLVWFVEKILLKRRKDVEGRFDR